VSEAQRSAQLKLEHWGFDEKVQQRKQRNQKKRDNQARSAPGGGGSAGAVKPGSKVWKKKPSDKGQKVKGNK
jgi:hypothetical protein